MIANLPIPFLSNESSIKILLTAVGVKLPSAFTGLYTLIQKLCNSLDLDINSFAPNFFHIAGQAKFSLFACESPDALPFILGLADPLIPHRDFQVVVGAAVAESQKDLIECALSFDKMVQDSVSSAVPCLFVFSSSSFDGSKLPACATQIPSDLGETEVSERVRQGFIRCTMEYLLGIGRQCEDLYNKGKDDPLNLAKIASYAYLLGGFNDASDFYNQALKHRAPLYVTSIINEFSNDPRLKIDLDKTQAERDLPSNLSNLKEDPQFPAEFITAIAMGNKCADKIYEIRTELRISQKCPQYSRQLLHYAISRINTRKKPPEQINYYYQLALLLLLHNGFKRTFMFLCNQYLNRTNEAPSFLLKSFTEVLTSGNDWCEQRVAPAAKLFSSRSIPRAIKNDLMHFLLSHLSLIHTADKQNEIINLIPSNMEISANILIEVHSVEYVPPTSPINEATSGKSNVFIYSPLQKTQNKKRCAAGDDLSFVFKLYNPLLIPLTFDMITLTATNAIVYPIVFTLPPKRSSNVSLLLKAKEVGQLTLSGFTFVTQNLTGKYNISRPIVIDVIEKLPTLVMKQPFRFETQLVQNSEINVNYQLINTSNVKVALKGIKFAPTPPVLTPTSLPIAYPPKVNPPLPPELEPGQSHQFELSFIADQSSQVLSFAVEYGTEQYTRHFELNEKLEIIDGPHISHVQVVSLDDHDDFESRTVTFMIVITNPFSNPIVVQNNKDKDNGNNIDIAPTVIEAHDVGTFLIGIDRIVANIDRNERKWKTDELESEHIRKCESTAVKLKNAPLSLNEKHQLWTTLLVKKKISEQLDLRWSTVTGLSGSLQLTHVNIDLASLILLQPPQFNVIFDLKKLEEIDNVWELTTKIENNAETTENIKIKAILSFELEDTGDKSNCIFTAGIEENVVESPCSFITAIHCLAVGKLNVCGRFYIEDLDAYFVKKAQFPLQ